MNTLHFFHPRMIQIIYYMLSILEIYGLMRNEFLPMLGAAH